MKRSQRQTRLKRSRSRSRSKTSKKIMMKQAKKLASRSYKKGKGGAPASYVGSIQGEFINRNGQQLFRNPVGGIA